MALSRSLQIRFFIVIASCHFTACALVGTSSLPGSPSLASKRSTLETRSSVEIGEQNLLRLRGGSNSAVSEARLKAQAQALAAVKAKASKLGASKTGPTAAELTQSTNAAANAAAAAPPSKPAPVAAPPVSAASRPVTAQQVPTQPDVMKATSTVSPSDFAKVPAKVAAPAAPAVAAPVAAPAAAPKPRVPMPVVEPDSDTSQLPGGEEPVQEITGAGSVKKVTDIAQKNRLLVMQCKALRARATDPQMKERLDARIFELEAAWQNYVKVDSTTTQHSLFAPKTIKINRSPSELVLDERTARRGKTRIPVTFTVRCALTQVGEKVLLLGDAEELGSWNPLAAVPLETTNTTYPLWHATVDMPAGAIVEYKYAIGTPGIFREQFDIVEWEGYMGNRGFKVPRKAYHIAEEYVEGINHGQELDYNIPEYLTMHRIGGSECFLDPEYASIY